MVDMQVGLLDDAPKHDLEGVIARINRLTNVIRRRGGAVVWIRHCGTPGEDFERHAEGWAFLPGLDRHEDDLVVEKTLNDPFAGTTLGASLKRLAPDSVLVAGWATDFCVDATVRSAVSHGFQVVVVGDGHTLADRPHLKAQQVIEHHHYVWQNLIAEPPVRVASTAELVGG